MTQQWRIILKAYKALSFFCVACGNMNKVRKPSDRQNIDSTLSQHVFPLWKSLPMNELEKSDSPTDVDQLLQQNLIMCKKCFYAHKTIPNL